MNKTIKRNVVVSAILAIMLCISLIAGATFALFTSESTVNIAVTSGKVNVTATANTATAMTKQYDHTYESGTNHMNADAVLAFDNEGGLSITNMLPGDGVQFTINVTNNSNVAVKYRTIIACETDDGLIDKLNIFINGVQFNGTTNVSEYKSLEANEALEAKEGTITVIIELDENAGNAYQNKTFRFSYKVEAVQGNAPTENLETGIEYVYTANDLMALQSKTGVSKIKFLADIDMTGKNWKGLLGGERYGENFAANGVTIIGNNKTISGLCAPLIIATQVPVTIENLTIKDSEMAYPNNLTDADYPLNMSFAAFIQLADSATINLTNCNLLDSKLNTTADTRVGGLVGIIWSQSPITISGCTVSDCELSAKGSVGGIVAQIGDSNVKATIKDCTVTGTKLTSTDNGNWRVGAIAGTVATSTTYINDCTSTNNTLSQTGKNAPDHELYGRIVNNCYLEIGGTVYCTSAFLKSVLASNNVTLTKDYVVTNDWTPYTVYTKTISIDGGYKDANGAYVIENNAVKCHTISGLTMPLLGAWVNITVKNLTIKDSDIKGEAYTGHNGNNYYAGAFVNFIDTGSSLTLNNCHTQNVDVEGASNSGNGECAGGLVGFASQQTKLSITDCTVTGGSVKNTYGNAAGVIGQVQAKSVADAENQMIKNCTVTNCNITGESNKPKTACIVGTVNGGATLYMINCTATGCTTGETTNPTNPTNLTNLVGRIVGKGTQIRTGENGTSQYVANGVSLNASGEYEISNAAGLLWFNDQCNNQGNSFSGTTLKLTADIDMGGVTWLPAGQNFTLEYEALGYANTTEFHGTFDGNNHTVSNIKIGLTKEQIKQLNSTTSGSPNNSTDMAMYSSGFIGYCAGGTVKNLTIAGATVTGSHYVGVIAGYLELKAQINSCKVTSSETTNTTITAEHINDAQCGDKVGGICGYINATCKIDSCTVEKTTIKAGRDAGTIVGCAGSTESGYTAAKITSCSVDETTVSVTEISDTEAGHCTDNSHGQNIGGQIGRDLRNS